MKKQRKKEKAKPYEQMTHPGERVQVDVKVVPRKCIADPELRLFQYISWCVTSVRVEFEHYQSGQKRTLY